MIFVTISSELVGFLYKEGKSALTVGSVHKSDFTNYI